MAAATKKRVRVGCAGWTIPREWSHHFAAEGSHLERYASQFSAVEINSSFYRPHQQKTYERWGQSVPTDFRFSVKAPKQITHELRLHKASSELAEFFDSIAGLGRRLGCVLVQLPPSLALETKVAKKFFGNLRKRFTGPVAFEPRHETWFTTKAETILIDHDVSRVAADPALAPSAEIPGGSSRIRYYRLHGSPRVYYSQYSDEYLTNLAATINAGQKQRGETWCIFDNTAMGWATENAWQLQQLLR